MKHPFTLYLLPNTLAQDFPQPVEYYHSVLPNAVLRHMLQLRFWIAEHPKTTRAVLKDVSHALNTPLSTPLIEQKMVPITDVAAIQALLVEAKAQGCDVGVMSEAGVPCVADPGGMVVQIAKQQGWHVQALAGPCSIVLALMHSGFTNQKFIFHSYLPIAPQEKSLFIQSTVAQKTLNAYTHICIETPYRNVSLFEALLLHLPAQHQLCVAKLLTLAEECVITAPIHLWQKSYAAFKSNPNVKDMPLAIAPLFDNLAKSPTLFLWDAAHSSK